MPKPWERSNEQWHKTFQVRAGYRLRAEMIVHRIVHFKGNIILALEDYESARRFMQSRRREEGSPDNTYTYNRFPFKWFIDKVPEDSNDEVKEGDKGNLQATCVRCGKWFYPNQKQAKRRLSGLNGGKYKYRFLCYSCSTRLFTFFNRVLPANLQWENFSREGGTEWLEIMGYSFDQNIEKEEK